MCDVTGCDIKPHARGLCRGHYGQVWRYGRITKVLLPGRQPHAEVDKKTIREESIKRDLDEAKRIYKVAVGFRVRMEWKKRIADLESALEVPKKLQTLNRWGRKG